MQHIQTHIPLNTINRGGGRIASDRYRESQQLCEDFTGLEQDTNRYSLLLLVKRVGKLAGFTPRMIHLLDYYLAYTTEIDWEQGSQPIVFQSLSRTALDLGVTERQIQKIEKQLFEVGAITWNDSGNHKRYGKRDSVTGRLLYAYGVDLTPLAYLKVELEDKLHQKQLYNEAWQATKRQISASRRQMRSLLLEWQLEEGADAHQIQSFEQNYQQIAFQLRTHIKLQELRTLLGRHQALHKTLMDTMGVGGNRDKEPAQLPSVAKTTSKRSCTSEPEFVHYKYKTLLNKNTGSPSDPGFQKNVAKPTEPKDLVSVTGLQHISIRQVLQAASNRFLGYLPLASRPMDWNDVVEAAYRLRSELHISQQSWAEACDVLGRVGASLCVLITDQGTQRTENRVMQPAAYFRGMINRAGELRLHNSIFGLVSLHSVREDA